MGAVKAQAGAIFIEPPPQPRPTANQRFMGDIDASAVAVGRLDLRKEAATIDRKFSWH
jgi:hypothetical protein